MTYNIGIPASNNTPSADQPKMMQNFNQIATSYNTDHVALSSGSNVGQHKQVTLSNVTSPAGQADPQSIIYSLAGVASTKVNLWYQNQNAAFFLSAIKAWAFCSGTGGGNLVISSQSFNITSVTRASQGQYTIVIPANVINSTNYSVLITTSNCSAAPASDSCFGTLATDIFTPTATQFVIRTFRQGLTVADPVSFSFVVIQI